MRSSTSAPCMKKARGCPVLSLRPANGTGRPPPKVTRMPRLL